MMCDEIWEPGITKYQDNELWNFKKYDNQMKIDIRMMKYEVWWNLITRYKQISRWWKDMKYENQLYPYMKMLRYEKNKITCVYKYTSTQVHMYASIQVHKFTKNSSALAN